MKRRNFLETTTLGTAGAMATLGLPQSSWSKIPTAQKRPNIIYMVVHDLGRYFSPYGTPIDTPNLQAFAEGGITLDHAYCGAPPCCPSRACAMTGQYQHTNGLVGMVNHGWSLSTDRKTIVDYLNDAGYETAWAGFQHERRRSEDNHYQVRLNKKPGEDVLVENVVDAAIGYLETKRDAGEPFYLNLGTQEVHASMWKPGAYYTELLDRPNKVYGIDKPEDVHVPAHCPDNDYSRMIFSRFVPCIRYMDLHFGRLFAAVDRLGLRENTLFVFTTDHGIWGSRAKGTVYERGMEIGTLMQMPGVIEAGSRMKELVNNIDFLPTFLEMAGVPCSSDVQGRSFWPRLCGGAYTPQEAIFTERNWHENYDPVRSVRTGRYHYLRNLHPGARRCLLPNEILNSPHEEIRQTWPNEYVAGGDFDQPDSPHFRYNPPRPHEELYDLDTDPEEFVNLADDPKYLEIKNKLAAQCDQWMHDTNDPVLKGPIPGTEKMLAIVAARMENSAKMSKAEAAK
ncbi:MAG: sulfatase [Kiritimatiellales bacterium]|nr:sulfatase [Kiritimatiellales bacterium]MCF7864660.1 sulfatase [Kiritimatiellales bacterium]